jgi:hypothetical protein
MDEQVMPPESHATGPQPSEPAPAPPSGVDSVTSSKRPLR